MSTVYVTIGNSDDKLSQRRWSSFVENVGLEIGMRASVVHGEWLSTPGSPYQNACWGFDIEYFNVKNLMADLAEIAFCFGQESIAWAVVDHVEMILPESPECK